LMKALDDAIADYTEAIRLAPRWSFPLNERAIAWQWKNDLDKALADYGAALALVPNDVVVHENAADAAEKKGDHPLAAEHYLRAGELRQSLKQTDKAFFDWNKAVELAPDQPDAIERRAEAYAERGDTEKAVADYTQAVKLRPSETQWVKRLKELKQKLAPVAKGAPQK